MTIFRIDVHRKSGQVMLWMETPYGLRPIMGCVDLEGLKEFAEMLLGFCKCRKEEENEIKKVSDKLLKQALGDEGYFREEI